MKRYEEMDFVIMVPGPNPLLKTPRLEGGIKSELWVGRQQGNAHNNGKYNDNYD